MGSSKIAHRALQSEWQAGRCNGSGSAASMDLRIFRVALKPFNLIIQAIWYGLLIA
jgi:hypothetical protein